MEDNFLYKMFWQFIFPSVMAAMGLAVANIADSLVVGIKIGSTGLAAIGITLPIYMIYALFYIGIGIGGSVEFARYAGAGKNRSAVQIFNMMIMASVVIGLIFTVCGLFFTQELLYLLGAVPADGEMYILAYRYVRILLISAPVFFINTPLCIFIRNDDNPGLSGLGYVVGNVMDVFLNFFLVIVMDVGVTGSVWSTVIGQFVSTMVFLPHLLKKQHILRIKPVKPDVKKILITFKVGFAGSNQYISQFLFIMIANRILISHLGYSGVAVFDVVMNVSYVGLLFFQAAVDAMQPLASTFHGEGNVKAEHKIFHMSMKFGMVAGCCLLALLLIFAKPICLLFGISDGESVIMGTAAVQIYCVGAVFAGINIILAGYYQSVGRENLTFLISILRGTVFLLAYTLLFGILKPELFWFLFPATEITSIPGYLLLKGRKIFQNHGEDVEEERIYSITINKSDNQLSEVIGSIEEFCGGFDASVKQSYYVTMTVEEICSAIMEHAFTEKEQDMYILITVIAQKRGDFRLCIRDNALAFNPFELKAKKVELEDEEDVLDGLGIMMVKSKAKEFHYRRYQKFNTLLIVV